MSKENQVFARLIWAVLIIALAVCGQAPRDSVPVAQQSAAAVVPVAYVTENKSLSLIHTMQLPYQVCLLIAVCCECG